MKANIKIRSILKYTLILVAGILLGRWFFSAGSDSHDHQHDHSGEEVTYTCSMHPQIRQNEPGKCPLCAMDLIPASKSGGAAMNPAVIELSIEALALGNIQTHRVAYGDGERPEIFLNGRIEVNEQKKVSLSADFPGRVEALYVNFTGKRISKGEKLATLYSAELINAQKELLEAARTRERNPQMYEAAREKLKRWRIQEQQIDDILEAGNPKTKFDIYAQAGGFVSSLLVQAGDYVTAGTPMVELGDLQSVWLLMDAYERDLPLVQNGAELTFSVGALPGENFMAKISYINPTIDPATRTAILRADAANPSGRLKPGMFAVARLQATTSNPGATLMVPASAVLWTGKRSVVYVKVKGSDVPAFEMREVTLGRRLGNNYEVQEGLQAGEDVVHNGVFYVDAAAQLNGNYSMMAARETRESIEVPESFKKELTLLAASYFDLKNHLVEAQAEPALKSAGQFMEKLKQFNTSGASDEAKKAWKKLSDKMENSLGLMQKDKALADLRRHFEPLSEAMLEAVAVFGFTADEWYEAYCPMVDDFRGAYWLSEKEEIYNPYFGDEMLHCGENTRIFKNE
ncbi:MAG: efflux RND transporter periplasmic adaptor subunit [Cyclobacteriaceae bacterium]|nr:efflux RND transporter periplasmic adaptor subunit [Cyclobacteriaceae bacterium]